MEIKFQLSTEVWFLFGFFFQSDNKQQEHCPDFKTVTFLKQKPKSLSVGKKSKLQSWKPTFVQIFNGLFILHHDL